MGDVYNYVHILPACVPYASDFVQVPLRSSWHPANYLEHVVLMEAISAASRARPSILAAPCWISSSMRMTSSRLVLVSQDRRCNKIMLTSPVTSRPPPSKPGARGPMSLYNVDAYALIIVKIIRFIIPKLDACTCKHSGLDHEGWFKTISTSSSSTCTKIHPYSIMPSLGPSLTLVWPPTAVADAQQFLVIIICR
jgi:hypothetical protein